MFLNKCAVHAISLGVSQRLYLRMNLLHGTHCCMCNPTSGCILAGLKKGETVNFFQQLSEEVNRLFESYGEYTMSASILLDQEWQKKYDAMIADIALVDTLGSK